MPAIPEGFSKFSGNDWASAVAGDGDLGRGEGPIAGQGVELGEDLLQGGGGRVGPDGGLDGPDAPGAADS